MVRLLVLDMLRRVAWWQLALLAIGLGLAWGALPARTANGHATLMAMSLAAVYIMGPVAMLGWLGTPVVPYLPVSRRDVWRAAWIMGALAPVALLTAVKIPGTIVGGAGWPTLALSAAMDFLYAGAGCAIVAKTNAGDTSQHAFMRALAGLMALLVGILWPFMVQQWLPTQWTELRSTHVALLAIGAALTTVGAFHSPAGGWPRPRMMHATSGGPITTGPPPSRLTGLPRLLVHELAFSATMAITLLSAFLLVALFAGVLMGSLTTLDHFIASQRLFIFNPASSSTLTSDDAVFAVLGWYGLFVATISARFPEALRHLRVLPLGKAHVHALLIGWPVMVWTINWLLLWLLHVAFDQPIVTLRFPLFLALVGLSQFAPALRLNVPAALIPLSFVAATALIPFARLTGGLDTRVLLAVWAIGTVAAVALNVRALSRSQTYKHLPTAVAGLKTRPT